MNTSGIMQTIIESSVDAGQAIATMEATAKGAAEWARMHRTTVTVGARGYTKPTMPSEASLTVWRENSDYYAGTFDRLIGLMVDDLLNDGETYMWVLAYADSETDEPSLYAGTVVSIDAADITFYDGVTIDRENLIAFGA